MFIYYLFNPLPVECGLYLAVGLVFIDQIRPEVGAIHEKWDSPS